MPIQLLYFLSYEVLLVLPKADSRHAALLVFDEDHSPILPLPEIGRFAFWKELFFCLACRLHHQTVTFTRDRIGRPRRVFILPYVGIVNFRIDLRDGLQMRRAAMFLPAVRDPLGPGILRPTPQCRAR